MDEETDPKTTPFDAEWEIRKFSGRLMDIMDLIDELKAKDKSLSARISRLRLETIEREPDELDEDEERGSRREHSFAHLDDLSMEQRAILMSRLIDRET